MDLYGAPQNQQFEGKKFSVGVYCVSKLLFEKKKNDMVESGNLLFSS